MFVCFVRVADDEEADSTACESDSSFSAPITTKICPRAFVPFRPPGPPLPLSAVANTPPSTPGANSPVRDTHLFCASIASATSALARSAYQSPSRPDSPCLEPAAKRRRERQPSIQVSTPTLSEDDDPEMKRATHNVLERRRREDLKVMYSNLRCSLPDLELKDKAAKVKILERANAFIQHLVQEKGKLDEEFKVLQRRNCQLRQVLSSRRAMKA